MPSPFDSSAARLALCAALAGSLWGQSSAAAEEGIPVTDPLVIAKCGNCHARDEHGNMERVSFERTSPENWQEVLRRMMLEHDLSLTPAEARSIVKYLSAQHGLAPEEAKPLMYDVERRAGEESNIPSDDLRHGCARCHSFARALLWRRSPEEWNQLAARHNARYKLPRNEAALAFLTKAAPLRTPEWTAWTARASKATLAGRWSLTASIPGHGKFYGEMQLDLAGEDEFRTTVHLTSVNDGSTIVRSGRSMVYAGYAWRGRSKGSTAGNAPDDLATDAREVMWIAPDQSMAEGRWFWGQYQEFGFDVKLRRPSNDPSILVSDRPSLKTGSAGNRVRLMGENIPGQVTAADLDFGPGVNVRRIVASTASEIVAEVDVAPDASLGKHDVSFRHSPTSIAIAIYDRVDYIKVTPDSAMAAFGDNSHTRGYQQFEAIGYQRGADGKPHTADDVELGPVEVNWSMEVFYESETSKTDRVGKVNASGFFTPAADNPNANFDVWVIATAKGEKDSRGRPLVGKSYVVVTVPTYTFNGHRYVRDLDRWVDDGPSS